jgi:hypothetical protein
VITFLLCVAINCHAMSPAILGGAGGSAAAAGCTISSCSGAITCTGNTGCIGRELFNGATSLSWSGAWGTTKDLNYTTSPIEGSSSFYMAGGGQSCAYTGTSTTYYAFAFTISGNPSTNDSVIDIKSGATKIGSITISTAGKILAYDSAFALIGQSGDAVTAGATAYVKFKLVEGSGAGTANAYYSLNGTSWTEIGSGTTGLTQSAPTKTDHMENGYMTGFKVDDIRISSDDINYW